MSWWPELWKTRSEDWLFGWLEEDQAPPGAKTGTVLPNEAYLNIFLKSARVVDVRKGFTTFYGAVHSHVSIPQRGQDTAEFNVVTTPANLKNVDAQSMDRVIQLNQRLLGPVPYVGGDVGIEVGLFSVAASNLAEPYLNLLESLSKKAGVSFITAAIPFAGPILEGVKLLTGSNRDVALEIGLSMTINSDLKQGYCIAMRAPKEEVKLSDLKVDPSDFRLLDRSGQPVADYPYMVLQIAANEQRDDWHRIPEIRQAYAKIQELYRDEDPGTNAAVDMFRRVARSCDDLIIEDAKRLAERVDKLYRLVPQPAGTRGKSAKQTFPDLEAVNLYGD